MVVPGHDWSTLDRNGRVAFLSQYVDTLLIGPAWPTLALTYSFPQTLFSTPAYVPNGEEVGYRPFTANEAGFVRETLLYLSSFTGLTFREVGGDADIRYGKHNMTAGGYASPYPSGEVYISADASTSRPGDYGLNTIVHESMHAFGLKHPGNYSLGGFEESGPFLPFNLDTGMATNLTYQDYVYNDRYTQTVRALDVAALQHYYGSSNDISNTTFRFVNNDALSFVHETGGWAIGTASPFLVVDTGGYDRLDFSTWQAPAIDRAYALDLDLEAGGGTIGASDPHGSVYDYFTSTFVDIDPAQDRLFNVEIYDLSAVEEVDGTPYSDRVASNVTLQRFDGGAGDDVYVAHAFNAGVTTQFIGGPGRDSIVYDVAHSGLTVDRKADGSMTVSNSQGIVDSLSTIEKIGFTDGALLYEIGPNGPAAYRLYGGAFDRTPDEGGLLFWTNRWLDTGRTLHDAATGFIQSAEFSTLYGTGLTNTAFIDQLYENVLHRAGEAAGVEYWNGYLAQGTGDRSDALVNFTQLAEYVAASQLDIEDGYRVV